MPGLKYNNNPILSQRTSYDLTRTGILQQP